MQSFVVIAVILLLKIIELFFKIFLKFEIIEFFFLKNGYTYIYLLVNIYIYEICKSYESLTTCVEKSIESMWEKKKLK